MICPYNQAPSQLPLTSMCIVFGGSCSLFVKYHTGNALGKALEKMIYEWIKAERAANQSVCDINIRVGDEEVAALTQCVEISRREEGKGNVSQSQMETQRGLHFAEVESQYL